MKWYIVTVIDIFTRQVVGIAIGRNHNSELVQEVLEGAITRTKTVPTIFHTDQGTEFMAERITSFLQSLQVQISVSDKASPWQNGYLTLQS
jgi:transposase InsO family protein